MPCPKYIAEELEPLFDELETCADFVKSAFEGLHSMAHAALQLNEAIGSVNYALYAVSQTIELKNARSRVSATKHAQLHISGASSVEGSVKYRAPIIAPVQGIGYTPTIQSDNAQISAQSRAESAIRPLPIELLVAPSRRAAPDDIVKRLGKISRIKAPTVV